MMEEDTNSLEDKLHTIIVDIAKGVLDFAAGWRAGSSLTKVPKTSALFAAVDYAKSYLSIACLVDHDLHPNDIAIVLGDNSNVFACSKMVLAKVDRNADSIVRKLASWSWRSKPASTAAWLRDWTMLNNLQNDTESMWIVEQALLSGSPLVLAKSRWRTEGIEVMPSCKTLVEVCKAASIDPYQILLEDDLKRDYSLGCSREQTMDNSIFLKVSSKTLAKWLRSQGFEHCLAYCTYFMTEKGNGIERFVFIKEDGSESIIAVNNAVYGFIDCMKNLENLAPGQQPEFNVYSRVEDACREMCRAFADNRAIELYGVCTEPNLLEVGNLTEEMAKIEIDIATGRGDRHGK